MLDLSQVVVELGQKSDNDTQASKIFMAVLEVETFSLIAGTEPLAFRALDEAMQEWCYLNRPGLARRTTARQDNGTYIVITLFDNAAQSDASYFKNSDSVVAAWNAVINESTRSLAVYELL